MCAPGDDFVVVIDRHSQLEVEDSAAPERLRERAVVDTIAVNVPIPPEMRRGVDREYDTFPGKPEEWND
jgi:hypothetical protein